MSITQKHAAQAINYLYAAQAITVTDDQAAVWADYTNAEIPDVQGRELLPAARRCLKDWATNSRAWKVDLPRFVQTIRDLRAERVRKEVQARGQIYPPVEMDLVEELEWRREAVSAISHGASRSEAEASAWAAIGQAPPQIDPTHKYEIPTIGRNTE